MREFLWIAIFLLIGGVGRVNAQMDSVWTCRLAMDGVPVINGAAALSDGGLAVVGTLEGDVDNNLLIARISAAGAVGWVRSFGYSGLAEQASAVVELPNGDLLLTGGQGPQGGNSNTLLVMGVGPAGDSLWTRFYFSAGQTRGNDVTLLADGNVAITGYRLGLDGSHSDMWLLKCNGSGDTLWARTIGDLDTDAGCRVLEAANGDLRIGGHSRSAGTGDFDLWLELTTGSGESSHREFYGPAETRERCTAMAGDNNGVFVGGYTQNLTAGNTNGYVARTNALGEFQWGYTYSRGFAQEQLRGMAPGADGGAVCVGWVGATQADLRPWVLALRSDGQTEFSRIDSSITNGWYTGIAATATGGGYFLWGNVVEGAQTKGYVMRTRPHSGVSGTVTNVETGDPLVGIKVSVVGHAACSVTNAQGWFVIGLPAGSYDVYASGSCLSPDTAFAVSVDADSLTPISLQTGTAVLAPCPLSSLNLLVHNAVADTTPFVICNTGSGPMVFSVAAEPCSPASAWLRVIPASGVVPPHSELAVGVCVEADTSNTAVWEYYGRLTVHAEACPDSVYSLPVFATVLDAVERVGGPPRSFAFHAPSPNPFNATTRLTFDLPQAAPVKLALYDMTGRLARLVWDAPLEAGTHGMSFDGSGLASGLYFARLDAGRFSATQKLFLVR